MNFHHPFQTRLPAWSDWLSLVFMSLAAPVVAAFIHSTWVYHRGIRLYNAEIGGLSFEGYAGSPPPGIWAVLVWMGSIAIPAIPTFLVLLPVRRRTLYRWLAWSACIGLWTYMCFQMEIAHK